MFEMLENNYVREKVPGDNHVCQNRVITDNTLEYFRKMLIMAEKEIQTIDKYIRDIKKLMEYAKGQSISKEMLLRYKDYLQKCGKYKISSINSYLAAVNHFCEVMEWTDIRVKMIKIQRETFVPENKEITMHEYEKLVKTAYKKGDNRLALIIETLGSTGIRISELRHITVESLKYGMADLHNKGKVRRILYPSELLKILREYVKERHICSGSIFITSKGNPVNRSNVWRMMKNLCRVAGVSEEKVYPHSMRHLFARSFYKIKKDIAKLADVLGHSSIDTTRIYIKTTGKEHKRQLNKMKMILGNNLKEGWNEI
ncbi:MAG: tyrosine-type recombinase/integrase [Lachnospira sp.]|jgi:hypothetical protein